MQRRNLAPRVIAMPRILMFFLVSLCLGLVGCGYLDTDLTMSDEEFEGSIGLSGIGVSGHGWGCSGGSYSSRGRRLPRIRAGRASMSQSQIMELGDMHIYGSRPAGSDPIEQNGAQNRAAQPETVDWVGHFDDVSKERQNVLLAAWVEGQLADDQENSAESSDLVDARSEVQVGER